MKNNDGRSKGFTTYRAKFNAAKYLYGDHDSTWKEIKFKAQCNLYRLIVFLKERISDSTTKNLQGKLNYWIVIPCNHQRGAGLRHIEQHRAARRHAHPNIKFVDNSDLNQVQCSKSKDCRIPSPDAGTFATLCRITS